MAPAEKLYFLWFLGSFLLGSIPFSVLIARWVLGVDLRRFGDGNPGSSNVFRAGSVPAGSVSLLLDFFKGALPVSQAYFFQHFSGAALVGIALAPILGHAFSPFLKGRGGNAVAVTFGVWAGLTLWEGPIVLGLFAALWLLVLDNSAWAWAAAMVCLLGELLWRGGQPAFVAVWLGCFLVLVWKHRTELARRPRMRKKEL